MLGKALPYPGAVSANPRVPGGWNRFKVKKISERLQGRADKKRRNSEELQRPGADMASGAPGTP